MTAQMINDFCLAMGPVGEVLARLVLQNSHHSQQVPKHKTQNARTGCEAMRCDASERKTSSVARTAKKAWPESEMQSNLYMIVSGRSLVGAWALWAPWNLRGVSSVHSLPHSLGTSLTWPLAYLDTDTRVRVETNNAALFPCYGLCTHFFFRRSLPSGRARWLFCFRFLSVSLSRPAIMDQDQETGETSSSYAPK